jgi:hypothetical protein
MKSANSCPFSLYTPNKLFVRLVGCLVNSFYNIDIQDITTNPNKYRAEVAYRPDPAFCWLHSRSYSHTFISQTVCAILNNKIYLLAGEE